MSRPPRGKSGLRTLKAVVWCLVVGIVLVPAGFALYYSRSPSPAVVGHTEVEVVRAVSGTSTTKTNTPIYTFLVRLPDGSEQTITSRELYAAGVRLRATLVRTADGRLLATPPFLPVPTSAQPE